MKRLLSASFIIFVSTFFTLIVLEVSFRLVEGIPLNKLENQVYKQRNLLGITDQNIYNPLVGWSLAPHRQSSMMTTGEHGIRMNAATITAIKKGGVLAVGDSFTAGSEVQDHEAWPAVLEKIINQPVINAAAGGYGADQIILRAEEMMPHTQPTTIIISYFIGSIDRATYKTYGGGNKPFFVFENGTLVHKNNPVPPLQASREDIGTARFIFGYSYLIDYLMSQHLPSYWLEIYNKANGYSEITEYLATTYAPFLWSAINNIDNDKVKIACGLLERIKHKADTKNIRLIFLIQFGIGQIVQWEQQPGYSKMVEECAKEMPIDTFNTWDYFKNMEDKDDPEKIKKLAMMHGANNIYGHHSPLGNRLLAEEIARQFFQNY
ncbi:MAG: hypothetical protein VX354_01100 [Pseudomonadota bacterium]